MKRASVPAAHNTKIISATIETLAAGGQGVARQAGVPIFVDGVAPGDRVDIEVYDQRKDFARGRMVRLLESSPQRVEPLCKLFKVCGGCQWQHIDYAWQLKAKQEIVRQTIKRIGGLSGDLVRETIGANPFFYRNKVQFPVANPAGSTRLLAGYYKQDSHELVNIKHCPVQPEPLDRLLACVKVLCEEHGITAYDEVKQSGLLRHIIARYSFDSKAILLTLVVNASPSNLSAGRPRQHQSKSKCVDLDDLACLARQVMEQVPEIAGVCLNFNQKAGNKVLADVTVPLAGRPYIVEKLSTKRADLPERLQQGLKFQLSSSSFFQVNSLAATLLMEEIYQAVFDQPAPFSQQQMLVVDAYAGVGAIALWLSPACRQVIAIEQNPAAVSDGIINAGINKIDNVQFCPGSVEEVLPQLKSRGVTAHVLVVDPPRKGLSSSAMESILNLSPCRLVYVSCNPATLARDLKVMELNGYKTKRVQPLDMFPQTFHIETVTLLDKTPEASTGLLS